MANSAEVLVNVAVGLLAGAIGTAAMTAAQTAEMKATGRDASTTPAKAVEKITRIKPRSDHDEDLLSNEVHWAYGTVLGGACGLLASMFEDREPFTGAAFFALAWGGGLLLPSALKVSSPPTQWGTSALLKDGTFHLIYAGVTVGAYHAVKSAIRSR